MDDMPSLLTKILDWIKHNKLAAALTALAVYVLATQGTVMPLTSTRSYEDGMANSVSYGMADMAMPSAAKSIRLPMTGGGAPIQESYSMSDRMISTNTNLSMKVNDVSDVVRQITTIAFQNGGFMVHSNTSSPEGGASGNISIKVQAEKLDQSLEAIRGLGVKVVSEYISGSDVTDQYSDLAERLRILETTKQKMEEILRSANRVADMLEVQRELIGIQSEIDSVKGQQQYLDKTTQLASIDVYLSTDELALPYAPTNAWRPQQVVKEATRSMIQTARGLANLAIWIGIYAPLWIPAGLIYWFWQKRSKKV